MSFFTDIFSGSILFLYQFFGGNLGLAIVAFTILVRSIILPLTLPSIKSSKRIRELQPELKKLKDQHKGDQKAYALAQAQLYKSYNINPLAGCLPQLLQFAILIILYRTIINLFSGTYGDLNFHFLWMDLSQSDNRYVAPVLAGVSQLLLSLMISPATQTRDIVPNKSKIKEVQKANKKEENVADMAANMQQQMIFMMPVMTAFIALRLPSGLALYWIVGTIFSIVTQYFISGWGGFAVYWNRYLAGKGIFRKAYLQDLKTPEKLEVLAPKTKPSLLASLGTNLKKESGENQSLATALTKLDGAKTQNKSKNTRGKNHQSFSKKSKKEKKNIRKKRSKQRKK